MARPSAVRSSRACAGSGVLTWRSMGKRSPVKAAAGKPAESMRKRGAARPSTATVSTGIPSEAASCAPRAAEPSVSSPSESSTRRGTRSAGSAPAASRMAASMPVARPSAPAVRWNRPVARSAASSGRRARAKGRSRTSLRPLLARAATANWLARRSDLSGMLCDVSISRPTAWRVSLTGKRGSRKASTQAAMAAPLRASDGI